MHKLGFIKLILNANHNPFYTSPKFAIFQHLIGNRYIEKYVINDQIILEELYNDKILEDRDVLEAKEEVNNEDNRN